MLCLLQLPIHIGFLLLFYANLMPEEFYYVQCILYAESQAIGHAIAGAITLLISCMRVQFAALIITAQYSIYFFTLYYTSDILTSTPTKFAPF